MPIPVFEHDVLIVRRVKYLVYRALSIPRYRQRDVSYNAGPNDRNRGGREILVVFREPRLEVLVKLPLGYPAGIDLLADRYLKPAVDEALAKLQATG